MVASDQAKVMSMQQSSSAQNGGWQQDIFSALKRSGVEIIAYVPDAAHAAAIDAANEDPETHAVSCTTEEDGIAICACSHLACKRAALLMPISCVGN